MLTLPVSLRFVCPPVSNAIFYGRGVGGTFRYRGGGELFSTAGVSKQTTHCDWMDSVVWYGGSSEPCVL